MMDIVKAMDFLLDCKIQRQANLSLAYFLIYAKSASLSEAARALRMARSYFYDEILPYNGLFCAKVRPMDGRRGGPKERRLILSSTAIFYTELIRGLAEKRLGTERCAQLRLAADGAYQQLLRERGGILTKLNTLRRISEKCGSDSYKRELEAQARRWGVTAEEVEVLMGVPLHSLPTPQITKGVAP